MKILLTLFRIMWDRNIPGGEPPLPTGFMAHCSINRFFSLLKGSFLRKGGRSGHGKRSIRSADDDPHASMHMKRNLRKAWFFGILPHEHGESDRRAYLLQKQHSGGGNIGAGWLRIDTFPYVGRKFWANWHSGLRRLYPYLTTMVKCFHLIERDFVFCGRGSGRYDGIDSGLSTGLRLSNVFHGSATVLLRSAPTGRIADVLRHDALTRIPKCWYRFLPITMWPRFASAEGRLPPS